MNSTFQCQKTCLEKEAWIEPNECKKCESGCLECQNSTLICQKWDKESEIKYVAFYQNMKLSSKTEIDENDVKIQVLVYKDFEGKEPYDLTLLNNYTLNNQEVLKIDPVDQSSDTKLKSEILFTKKLLNN